MFNIANHFRKTVQTNISGVNYIENIDIGYTYIYVKFKRSIPYVKYLSPLLVPFFFEK